MLKNRHFKSGYAFVDRNIDLCLIEESFYPFQPGAINAIPPPYTPTSHAIHSCFTTKIIAIIDPETLKRIPSMNLLKILLHQK